MVKKKKKKVNLLCCIGIAYPLLKCDSKIFQMLVFVCTNDVIVQANPNIVDSLNFCVWRHTFLQSPVMFSGRYVAHHPHC